MTRDDGGGSGINWTVCKSFVPRSRRITTPAPHHVYTLQAGCTYWRPTINVKALKDIPSDKGQIPLHYLVADRFEARRGPVADLL